MDFFVLLDFLNFRYSIKSFCFCFREQQIKCNLDFFPFFRSRCTSVLFFTAKVNWIWFYFECAAMMKIISLNHLNWNLVRFSVCFKIIKNKFQLFTSSPKVCRNCSKSFFLALIFGNTTEKIAEKSKPFYFCVEKPFYFLFENFVSRIIIYVFSVCCQALQMEFWILDGRKKHL